MPGVRRQSGARLRAHLSKHTVAFEVRRPQRDQVWPGVLSAARLTLQIPTSASCASACRSLLNEKPEIRKTPLELATASGRPCDARIKIECASSSTARIAAEWPLSLTGNVIGGRRQPLADLQGDMMVFVTRFSLGVGRRSAGRSGSIRVLHYSSPSEPDQRSIFIYMIQLRTMYPDRGVDSKGLAGRPAGQIRKGKLASAILLGTFSVSITEHSSQPDCDEVPPII